MYKYHSSLGFLPIKNNEEGKCIHNEIFKNIPHFIKNCLCVNFLQDGFGVYNDRVRIIKIWVVTPITDYMVLLYFFQNN